MSLKIVHIAAISPFQCGLYETTREQVAFERKIGLDSYLFDPRPETLPKEATVPNTIECPKCKTLMNLGERSANIPTGMYVGFEDRGCCSVPESFLKHADILVSHSGIYGYDQKYNKPFIHIAHGRPYSSILMENAGDSHVYSTYAQMYSNPNLKAAVTLWPEYVDYLDILFKEKLHFIQCCVDLDRWQKTPSNYNFDGKMAECNIVMTDVWRLDKDPYYVLNAYRKFHKTHKNCKLHIYAFPNKSGWSTLVRLMQAEGMIGDIKPHVQSLYNVYNAADLFITPHVIATRTVREALSMGINTVAGSDNRFTPYKANPENLDEYAAAIERAYNDWKNNKQLCAKNNRKMAEESFDPIRMVTEFKNLYNNIMEK